MHPTHLVNISHLLIQQNLTKDSEMENLRRLVLVALLVVCFVNVSNQQCTMVHCRDSDKTADGYMAALLRQCTDTQKILYQVRKFAVLICPSIY